MGEETKALIDLVRIFKKNIFDIKEIIFIMVKNDSSMTKHIIKLEKRITELENQRKKNDDNNN